MRSYASTSREDTLYTIIMYGGLSIVILLMVYPLTYVLSCSVSDPLSVISGKVKLFPIGFTLRPYARVLEHSDIWMGYRNTILYTVAGTIINLVLTILGAYALSRKDLKGGSLIMGFLIVTMFFRGGMIPTYLVVRDLGMVNTIWALILPNAVNTFNLIVARTFFQHTIPHELRESAFMDGCLNTRFLLHIVLPLSGPIIAVLVLRYAVHHWNDYFSALLYLSERDRFPLQLILREILIQSQIDDMTSSDADYTKMLLEAESMKYSIIILASLPMLIIYPFLQKFFVKGVMVGAVKG